MGFIGNAFSGAGVALGGLGTTLSSAWTGRGEVNRGINKIFGINNLSAGAGTVVGSALEGRRALFNLFEELPNIGGLAGFGKPEGMDAFAGRMVGPRYNMGSRKSFYRAKDPAIVKHILDNSGKSLKVPGFFARTAGEHLRMGAVRMAQTALKPSFLALELGIGLGMAFYDTDFNDYADPYNGVPRKFAKNLGATPGFLGGAAVGAAIGNIVPGIGTAVGYIAGGVIGSTATSEMADIPWKLAEKGREMRMRRGMPFHYGPGFVDSEGAATMRQITEQMLMGSMMNARSALGMEALSFHS